eukprot:5888265-Alexandrium_andersonii.AAC.1
MANVARRLIGCTRRDPVLQQSFAMLCLVLGHACRMNPMRNDRVLRACQDTKKPPTHNGCKKPRVAAERCHGRSGVVGV